MALKRNERYPGRFSNPTTAQPQGAFKNRTAPNAQDGSYLEQDWANDWSGFFGRLLTAAGITPNGNVDTALSSQYYDALLKAITNSIGAPAIGVPFFWGLSTMPNAVMSEWSDMIFLKFNGAAFSAAAYPKLALAWPALVLPEARGEFPRIWDDGRGIDTGRALLSVQLDAMQNITGNFSAATAGAAQLSVLVNSPGGAFYPGAQTTSPPGATATTGNDRASSMFFDASRVVRTSTETRARNIAFNLLVRAK